MEGLLPKGIIGVPERLTRKLNVCGGSKDAFAEVLCCM
jgi:hypothetical protein